MNGFPRPDTSHALPARSDVEQFNITVQNCRPVPASFACNDVGGDRRNATEEVRILSDVLSPTRLAMRKMPKAEHVHIPPDLVVDQWPADVESRHPWLCGV